MINHRYHNPIFAPSHETPTPQKTTQTTQHISTRKKPPFTSTFLLHTSIYRHSRYFAGIANQISPLSRTHSARAFCDALVHLTFRALPYGRCMQIWVWVLTRCASAWIGVLEVWDGTSRFGPVRIGAVSIGCLSRETRMSIQIWCMVVNGQWNVVKVLCGRMLCVFGVDFLLV